VGKMAILMKAIYMFDEIPIKIAMIFFTEIEKSILRIKYKHKRPQIAKAILSKKSNTGGITIPDFKLQYRTIIIKTAWCQAKPYMITNGTEDPDLNPCSYSCLIFDKGAHNICLRKEPLLQQTVLEKLYFHM
jgi:hypothetical protein